MAITNTLTTAVPYLSANKVVEWKLGMTYTNGVSGDSDYHTTDYIRVISHDNWSNGFGLSAESAWNTLTQLEALCPQSIWLDRFTEEVNDKFNPPAVPIPDNTYVIPS